MTTEEELREVELEIKKLELKVKEREHLKGHRFSIANAAVLVTILGGISAISFQAIGLNKSIEDRKAAEIRETGEFNFRGVELFIKENDSLITCDPKESYINIEVFSDLFDQDLMQKFRRKIVYKTNSCIANAQNTAAVDAINSGLEQSEIDQKAEEARYETVANQSAIIEAATSQDSESSYQIFIQFTENSDRARAVELQKALRQDGFGAPGIEAVSVGPTGYEIRYYYEAQRPDAERVQRASARALGLDASAIKLNSLEGRYPSLPQGTMEFWFPRSGR